MTDRQIVFVLGDKLPTYYDAGIAIFSVSTQRTGQHMKRTIHSYCLALIDKWTKSFGKVNVKSRSTITRTLVKLVDSYWNAVYNKAHRKKAKHKGEEQEVTSKRQLNKLWQEKVINKQDDTNSSLLDRHRR